MKERIENLIKEVGVNDVENILQEIKSKINVKEELKKDFIELLTGSNISFDGDYINYRKSSDLIINYSKSKNYFYFNHKSWSNFENKYNLNYQELRGLLEGVVEEVLKYKGVTPWSHFYEKR